MFGLQNRRENALFIGEMNFMKILSKWRIFVTLAEKVSHQNKKKNFQSMFVCLENVYGKSFLEGKFRPSQNGGSGSFLV
jgi:hypothetical protein